MDGILEQLKEYGADIDGTMGRFLGDIDLYRTCFTTFLDDEAFAQLGAALAEDDYAKAFESAHTLKGIIGNMGLTPLYEVICKIVEDLRKNDYFDLQAYYAEVIDQLGILKKFSEA
ncbi:MAG: Hpt domain-containing protein [Evtepia sp.]